MQTAASLHAALDHLRAAPVDEGVVTLVVRRPAPGEREVLEVGQLDPALGLVGDGWSVRPCRRTPDHAPHPDMQLTLMGERPAALVAGHPDRRALAGDQILLDLDLSEAALPAGSRLALGTAVVEVTAVPHTGCAKFVERFGAEAMRFVNGPVGRPLRLRGLNARVVVAGQVRAGDPVRRLVGDAVLPDLARAGA